MSFLMIMLMIFSMAGFFSIILNTKFDIVASLPFFLIIIVTYIAGLLGDLRYGVYFIIVFSSFCALFSLGYCVHFRKTLRHSVRNIFTAGFLAFGIFTVIMLLGHRGRLLENWDEFAHWGATVKGMYRNNVFSTAENAPILTKHEGYPPGTALLHYFFTKCAGTYHESNIIRSMGVFAFSLFLPVFSHTQMKRGQYIRTLVFFLVILLLPTIVYSDFYVTLYVDGILGVLFSYMLYSYFSERKITAVFLLRFCAAAFVIALIKSSGVAFAAIALIIIVADVFFFHPKDTKSNTRQSLFSTLCLLLPVLALFVSRGSWKFYLQQVNSAEWNTSGVTLSGLMNLFTQNIPNYQIEGINEFVRRFTTVHPFVNNTANTAVELTYPINISYVLFIGALFVVAAIIAQLNKKTRPQKAFVFTAVMLTVCFLGYAVSLLILYLFTFQQWETVSCAAMDRYLGSYVLGVILFMTSMLLQSIPVNSPVSRLKIKSSSILAAILLFVLCFSNVNSIAKITVSSHFDILRIQRMRSDYSAAEQVAVRYENVTGNVLILSQETSYYYYNLCRYSLSPLRCTYGVPYALVDISDPQEIAAKQSSLASALTKCKYVFLMKTDDAFKRHYGKFFASPEDISDNSFYAVNQDERGIYLTKLVTG